MRQHRTTYTCPQCGENFQRYPSQVSSGKGPYCSRACASAARRAPLDTRSCAWCGNTFQIEPWKPTRYCSIACANTGSGNPDGVEARFWSRVDRSAGAEACWQWTGQPNEWGYGTFVALGEHILAHRYSYELLVGTIPAGLELDHLCRNTLCVNPAHLEPVTTKVNTHRSHAPNILLNHAGVCKRGHPLTPDNIYLRRDGRGRQCRICTRLASKKWREDHYEHCLQRDRDAYQRRQS